MSYSTKERNFSPLIDNASTQRWFMLRQSVPIGYHMLVIKNNEITAEYEHGMQWTSVVLGLHKGGAKLLLVDMRDRFEEFNFNNELYTRDQNLINLTFVVHYRVADIKCIALNVQDPIGQLLNRTKAKLLDITIRTSFDDFITYGTRIYLDNLAQLSHDLREIGLELIRAEVTNFKLPDRARDKYAKVMGDNREMLMEIDRLKAMKDKGVINDYMKLKMIEGLSSSNFPPMQMYAMQMLGGNPMAPQSQSKPESALVQGQHNFQVSSGEREPARSQTGIKPGVEVLDNKGTILKKMDTLMPTLVNLDTGAVFILEKDLTQIGRGTDNEIALADQYASRKHAQIVKGPSGEVVAINLSQNNPISVNGIKSINAGDRVVLKENDVIEIGYTKLRYINKS